MSVEINKDINKSMRQSRLLSEIKEYTDSTTIHGIKYLGERRRPIFERGFWVITFIISFLVLGSFILEVFRKFQERSIILVEDIEPTEIYKIPFPAVTVCPQFKIISKFYSYENTLAHIQKLYSPDPVSRSDRIAIILNNTDAMQQYDLALQICERDYAGLLRLQYVNFFNFTHLTKEHVDLLLQISPNIRNVMGPARYQEDAYKFRKNILSVSLPAFVKLFSTIITNEGVCFTFNLPTDILRTENLQNDYQYYNISDKIQGWDSERGYFGEPSFPRRSLVMGELYGLMCSLYANPDDLYNRCSPTKLGYKILVHSPTEYPSFFTNFVPLELDAKHKIKLKPKITTTSPSLRSYKPQERQCYFNDERRLQFFTFYNKANCKLECFANYTIAKYGCVHFSIPRNSTTPICGSDIDIQKAYAVYENSQSIANYGKPLSFPPDLENEFTDLPNITCNCFPECNAVDYEFSLHTHSMPDVPTTSARNAQHTSFCVYFEQNIIAGITRKQLYTFVDLVSNFGGLVGLFIGASILSIFEILYFGVIRQSSKFCKTSSSQID